MQHYLTSPGHHVVHPANLLTFAATTNFAALAVVLRAGAVTQPSHSSVTQSQCRQILALLEESRGEYISAVTLSKISLQYSSRIFTLRRLGYRIVNRVERVPGGGKRGYFKLLTEREARAIDCLIPAREQTARGSGLLFREGDMHSQHRDDG
jgi:hypothetical protein